MASFQMAPLLAFLIFAVSALNCAASAMTPQPHGASRMFLVGEDRQPSMFLLLGPNGWVQQQPILFDGSAAARIRFQPPFNKGTRGNRAQEDSGTATIGKVEKKWSRFEPSIRFF